MSTITITVTESESWFVARSTDPELATQGKTAASAVRNFAEALALLAQEEFVQTWQPPDYANLEPWYTAR